MSNADSHYAFFFCLYFSFLSLSLSFPFFVFFFCFCRDDLRIRNSIVTIYEVCELVITCAEYCLEYYSTFCIDTYVREEYSDADYCLCSKVKYLTRRNPVLLCCY